MAAKVGSPEFQGLAGTYRYMAPEIVNDRSYDEKVDLWSVGAIMYCILAGASQHTLSCEMLHESRLQPPVCLLNVATR
jgi:serine/threonine protein kinase